MRALRLLFLALTGLCFGHAFGQMPGPSEFEQAVTEARPEALQLGLRLHTGTLWLRLLHAGTPMMAALGPDGCHIGYSAYNPRADFAWLFPVLLAQDRALWLGGFIRHELAHCADMRDTPFSAAAHAGSASNGSALPREVLADLAFALHVDARSPHGDVLVERLAALRTDRRAEDPDHDSSAALRCYLSQRSTFSPGRGDWLTALRAWRTHCSLAERTVQASRSVD